MSINPNCYVCCGTGIVQPEQGVTFGGAVCIFCDNNAVFRTEKDPTVTCRGDARLGTACGKCSRCFEARMPKPGQVMILEPAPVSDLDLERRALKACGYRVHEKERNGTRWLMAAKGLHVQYKHWHPLTSIHQAMQLLIDCPGSLRTVARADYTVSCWGDGVPAVEFPAPDCTAQDLINAQCRAIVTACASLEPVR